MGERVMELEGRVVELETRLAFQDDTIQALNEALVDQQRQMERLERVVAQLTERYQELAGQYGEQGDEAPPPHY